VGDMKYKICEGVAVRKLGNEIFFITPKTSQIHTLDEIGALIWDGIVEGMEIEKIGEKISSEYDETKVQIIKDIEELIQKLTDGGLIQED
jgi:Coenzyme PQQ synthesis protein D (PqqD)